MPSAVGPMKRKIRSTDVVDQRLEEVPLEDGEDLVVVLEADPVDVAEPDAVPVREREQDRGDRRDPDQPDVQDGRDPDHRQHDPAVAPIELPETARLRRLATDAAVGVGSGPGLPLPLLPPLRCESEKRARRCARGGRDPALLREDGLGLGLHVFEDRVDARGVGQEVGERLTGDVRGELRAGVAVEELGHRRRRGDRLERLLLQRGVDRGVDVVRRRRRRSGPRPGTPPARPAVPKW